MKTLVAIFKALLLLALAALVALNVVRLFSPVDTGGNNILGYSSAVVLSGSMSGTIEVNDLVIIHRQETYTPGDIITYRSGSSLITHRIVELTPGGFITKGDANNTRDTHPVAPAQIVGRVVAVIPRMGSFIAWLRTPLGLCALTVAGFALLLPPSQKEKGKFTRT